MQFISLRIRYLAFGLESVRMQLSDRVELTPFEVGIITLFCDTIRQAYPPNGVTSSAAADSGIDKNAKDAKGSKDSKDANAMRLVTVQALAGADLLLPANEWAGIWATALGKHCSMEKLVEFFSDTCGFQLDDLKRKFADNDAAGVLCCWVVTAGSMLQLLVIVIISILS